MVKNDLHTVKAIVKGVTADRHYLVLNINGVEVTAVRNFVDKFSAKDLRQVMEEAENEVRIPVLTLMERKLGKKHVMIVPEFKQTDTLVVSKLQV